MNAGRIDPAALHGRPTPLEVVFFAKDGLRMNPSAATASALIIAIATMQVS
jgi:hypothetical protein